LQETVFDLFYTDRLRCLFFPGSGFEILELSHRGRNISLLDYKCCVLYFVFSWNFFWLFRVSFSFFLRNAGSQSVRPILPVSLSGSPVPPAIPRARQRPPFFSPSLRRFTVALNSPPNRSLFFCRCTPFFFLPRDVVVEPAFVFFREVPTNSCLTQTFCFAQLSVLGGPIFFQHLPVKLSPLFLLLSTGVEPLDLPTILFPMWEFDPSLSFLPFLCGGRRKHEFLFSFFR